MMKTTSKSPLAMERDRSLHDNDTDSKMKMFETRSKKLKNFFGDDPKLDVTLQDIMKYGLPALLASRIPLTYFLTFLLEEHCSENLFFYLESSYYITLSKTQPYEDLFANATHIFNTYLTPNSFFEVNVDHKIRHSVEAALRVGRDLRTIFDSARDHICTLLDASFLKFQKTVHFNHTLKESTNQSILTDDSRDHALAALLMQFQKTALGPISIMGGPDQKRFNFMSFMVKEFCRTVLEIHLKDDYLTSFVFDARSSVPVFRSNSFDSSASGGYKK